MSGVHERLYALAEEAARAEGCQVVEVEYHAGTQRGLVRVYIDRPLDPEGPGGDAADGSGIRFVECQAVSQRLSRLLDLHDPIPHAFVLEVSSPGLNRPLRTREDFARFVGKRVNVHAEPGDHRGRKRFKGILTAVDAEGIVVEEEDGPSRVPFVTIRKANLKYEFPAPGVKKGGRRVPPPPSPEL